MSETEKKIIYLVGPTTGMPGNNYEEFALATEKLRALDYGVINVHEILEEHDHTKSSEMGYRISKLALCHMIITLKDWELCVNATKEVSVARFLDIPSEPIHKFLKQHS